MTSIVSVIASNISNVVTLIKYLCVHYLFTYFVIYLEASALAQTVSNDTVISEKCIVKFVKERYCTFSQFHAVNLEKEGQLPFRQMMLEETRVF